MAHDSKERYESACKAESEDVCTQGTSCKRPVMVSRLLLPYLYLLFIHMSSFNGAIHEAVRAINMCWASGSSLQMCKALNILL